ncbi:hypothetical protein SCE1572_52100 [Sorangium cellulosum So0157-2]|uniref:Uncharacterized protein n=2 Tax=Sorangium cellulosum TaxID=56 RepID=S4YHF0_SORCE|nr:hypothetical protein SCE1572_52100 [Sorangium cellulosum So0157-2]
MQEDGDGDDVGDACEPDVTTGSGGSGGLGGIGGADGAGGGGGTAASGPLTLEFGGGGPSCSQALRDGAESQASSSLAAAVAAAALATRRRRPRTAPTRCSP